jgi:hypothetical protein
LVPFPSVLTPFGSTIPLVPPLIQQAWSSPFSGSPNYIWESKLKAVKLTLKDWVKSSFTPPHQERIEKVGILSGIQQRIEEEEVTETLLTQEK